MKSRINRDEREISISELWWFVISKWKWLVIGMVVGALLMGAFSVYKSKSVGDTTKEYTMDSLTQEEQEEVNKLIEDYKFYQSEEERLENNYLMGLDYNTIVYCLVTYYIDTEYSYNYTEVKENYASTLVSMYKTYAHSNEVHDKIMELNILGLEEADLPHLYGASSEGYIVKIGGYASAEDSELIIETISKALEAYHDEATELVGEHKLIKISVDTRETYSDSIKNRQTFNDATIEKLNSEIEDTKKSFSEAQLAVFMKETQGTSNATVVKQVINIKYIIVGAAGGVLLIAIIIVIVYLSGKKIYSVREIKQVYDINIFGSILRDESSNKFFLKKLNRINTDINEAEQKAYISKTIEHTCKQSDITELYICSSVSGMENCVKEIVEMLGKVGIKCNYGENINSDVNEFEKMTNNKNIVLVEQLNVTNKSSFENEIEICDKHLINILGMIAIV